MRRFLFLLVFFPLLSFADGEGDSGGGSSFSFGALFDWLMTKINGFVKGVNDFILSIWELIVWFVKSAVLTIFDLLKEVVFWVFDTFLSLAVGILSGIGSAISATFDFAGAIAGLPEPVINMFGLLGLGQALVLIAFAITTRLLLQLIPFVRLGS